MMGSHKATIPNHPRLRGLGLSVVASLALCSCALGPDFVKPDQPPVRTYLPASVSLSGSKPAGQSLVSGKQVPNQWWRLFQSAQLDDVMQEALAHNATLEAALASLQQSQHNLQAGYGIFFPQIGMNMAASRERTAPIAQGLKTPSNIFNVVTLSAGISYDLDLFGGERRAVEALAAQVDSARFAGKAAYVTLSANVVNAVIARAAYAVQLRATEQLWQLLQQQLAAVQAQVKSGTVAYTAELALRTQISSAEASLANLKQQVSQSENLLATLQGRFPAQSTLPMPELDQLSLPDELPLTLPSELAQLRPDIMQAQAQLHVASANIGVATAALFPRISLTGNAGQTGTSLANLQDANGRFWSVGPSVVIPVFEGGTQWFQREAAKDAFQVAQAGYRQTVLSAFAQVATVLQALRHDSDAWRAQQDALGYAGAALQSATAGFNSGINSYLDVLVADVLFHQAMLAAIQANAQRHQDTVALYAALGGGWWAGAAESQP